MIRRLIIRQLLEVFGIFSQISIPCPQLWPIQKCKKKINLFLQGQRGGEFRNFTTQPFNVPFSVLLYASRLQINSLVGLKS